MHVARPTATGADGKASGQVCFGAGGKRCRFFMPDMNPLQLFLFSNRVGKPIEGVTRKPINPFHSRLNECIYHQLRDVFSHNQHPACFLSSVRNLTADISETLVFAQSLPDCNLSGEFVKKSSS